MTYFDELCRAMSMLSDAGATFFGQAVACEGTAMQRTLAHLPMEKRIELPVAEDMQMGLCTGIALGGGLPVCCYPRINFLLLAINQLVLHLDKLPAYSRGDYLPKVIIRTAIATDKPLHPQAQHIGDYTHGIKSMLEHIAVRCLYNKEEIMPEYEWALKRKGSVLMVEYTSKYDE